MEPSDQSTSPTVFDLPPRETESLAATAPGVAASTLRDGMDGVIESSPGKPEADDLWFTKYAGSEAGAAEGSGSGHATDISPVISKLDELRVKSDAQKSAAEISTGPPAPLRPAAGSTSRPPDAAGPTPASHRAGSHDESDKAAQLGFATHKSGALVAGARHSNLRRTAQMGKLMALTFAANVLVIGVAGCWLHKRLSADIEARIVALPAPEPVITPEDKKPSPVPIPATPPPDPGLPPAHNELVLLKERNRLTAYADEAIATGARAPYERLWEAIDDPRLANLVHAARGEILRVQNFYLSGSRIERYDIPVATYYPENGVLKDSQLKDDQLIALLGTAKNPWEVRMKAANLLGMRRSMEIGDALMKAVKKDDNLDVVKEATFSFEQMTGFRAQIFDADSLETWWKNYKATPPPPTPKAMDTKTKSPPPPEKPAAGNP